MTLPVPIDLALSGYFCLPKWQMDLDMGGAIYACGNDLISIHPGEFAGHHFEDIEVIAKQCFKEVPRRIDDSICDIYSMYFSTPVESISEAARSRFQELTVKYGKHNSCSVL